MCQPTVAKSNRTEFERRKYAADVKELSRVSNLRSAAAIGIEYLIFASAITVAILANQVVAYLLAIIVIAARQQGLAILLHEAGHYRLFTVKWVNDLVSDLFLAFPLGLSTSLHRKTHRRHHQFVNDDVRDPDRACVEGDDDWEWPKTKWEVVLLFCRDLCGLSALRMGKLSWLRWSPWLYLFRFRTEKNVTGIELREKMLLIGWTAMVGSILFWLNVWVYVFLFWILPAMTVLMAFVRIRVLAEHYGIDETHELKHSRTVIASSWERFLISPYNVNYHLEHHTYASVTCFNLAKLHDRLMCDEIYSREAPVSQGYLSVLNSLLSNANKGEASDRQFAG